MNTESNTVPAASYLPAQRAPGLIFIPFYFPYRKRHNTFLTIRLQFRNIRLSIGTNIISLFVHFDYAIVLLYKITNPFMSIINK